MKKATKKVAKKAVAKAVAKVADKIAPVAGPTLFFASKDKWERAQKLVVDGKYKTVRDAYDALGGKYSEGTGYAEV